MESNLEVLKVGSNMSVIKTKVDIFIYILLYRNKTRNKLLTKKLKRFSFKII